jgi:CRISPR-associated protein Cmr6
MSTPNNSLRYYKEYYEGNISWGQTTDKDKKDNEEYFKRQNEKLFQSTLPKAEEIWAYPGGLSSILLITTYPGLLLGSGLSHGSGLMGELKLGFFLDYTTGLPTIPGSSVKGVLRSVFPQLYVKEEHPEKAEQILILIQYYLKEITTVDWSKEAIDKLETFLFGTVDPGKSESPKPGQSIFHDALPDNADRVRINGRNTKQYLGDDFITPHKEPLKNPIPIGFLKVLPGVAFRFQFDLKPFSFKAADDTVYSLDDQQQQQLFEQILLEIGVGAKTNVGYGQFLTPNTWEAQYGNPQANEPQSHHKREPISTDDKKSVPETTKTPKNKPDTIINFKLMKNYSYKAELIAIIEKYAVFKIKDDIGHLENQLVKATKTVEEKLKKKGYETPLKEGQFFPIFMQDDSTPGTSIANFQVNPPKP